MTADDAQALWGMIEQFSGAPGTVGVRQTVESVTSHAISVPPLARHSIGRGRRWKSVVVRRIEAGNRRKVREFPTDNIQRRE